MGELDKHWGRVVVNENILHNKYMLSFCQKLFFSEQNSFMHMFNVSTLYRQSIKFFHQKLW